MPSYATAFLFNKSGLSLLEESCWNSANSILYFYRLRREASEGYVFTGVCHSLCPQGGGGVTSNASWDRSHRGV